MSGIESVGILFVGGMVFILAFIIINIFYCLSLYSAMKLIPTDKHVFPAWLVWLILIPYVGIIFSWFMEPFGLPKTFENFFADNSDAVAKCKTLFGLGLAHVILLTICIIPGFRLIFGIASLIVWIIYWVKVVSFKNEYLLNLKSEKNS